MTGILLVLSTAFRRLTTSKPSRRGIWMSSNTRSGALRTTIRSASAPSLASAVAQPSVCTNVVSNLRLRSSSSTTSTVGDSLTGAAVAGADAVAVTGPCELGTGGSSDSASDTAGRATAAASVDSRAYGVAVIVHLHLPLTSAP